MKKFSEWLEETVTTTTTGGADIFTPIKADGKAFGLDYFECDDATFNKCLKGGKKFRSHWMKFLGNKNIQQYAKKNKLPFLLKRAGIDQYLRAR